jgi:hypothetical protein
MRLEFKQDPAPQCYTARLDGFEVSIGLQTHDDNEWYWSVHPLDSEGDAEADPVATGICMAWEMAVACSTAAVELARRTSTLYLLTPQERRPT